MMRGAYRKVMGFYLAAVVLLVAIFAGKYIYDVLSSVREYKTITFSTAKERFGRYESDFITVAHMMQEDFYPLKSRWVHLSKDNISKTVSDDQRKERYSNILSMLPVYNVVGSHGYITFLLARWGFAGDTQGKAIVWYQDGKPFEGDKIENIFLGVEGWYYLHYR